MKNFNTWGLLATIMVALALPSFAMSHSNGRQAVHGFLLFGNGPHYIAHIPMRDHPHDMQLIARIALHHSNGEEFSFQAGQQIYSLKPKEAFSLDAFANGHVVTRGDFYLGNYEQENSHLVYENVSMRVTEQFVWENFANTSFESNKTHYIIPQTHGSYVINRLHRGSQMHRISWGDYVPHESVAPKDQLLVAQFSAFNFLPLFTTLEGVSALDGKKFTLRLIDELSCLRAPDFYLPCSSTR